MNPTRRVFAQTGQLLARYGVVPPNRPAGGSEYPVQNGFGWTSGVLLRRLSRYRLEE